MSTAALVASTLLAAAIAYAAARKLTHRPEVVAEYARAGVAEERLNLLAWILLAAAVGLLGGIGWHPLGVAAAAGLVVYFAGEISFHLRAGDLANVAMPVALELLAVTTLVLRLAS